MPTSGRQLNRLRKKNTMGHQTPEMRKLCERAKSYYLVGETPMQISERLGVKRITIQQWVTRYKWQAEKKARRDQSTRVIDQLHSDTLADVIVQHQERVKRAVDRHMDTIAQGEVADPDALVKTATALEKLDSVGRRNLGMNTESDSGAARTTFNFNLGGVKVTKKLTFEQDRQATIEAPTTQVTDSEQDT